MQRALALFALTCGIAGCGVVGAQPAAWAAGGVTCVASPAPNGTPESTTGCPPTIDTHGPDFAALDAITRSGGPHRYLLDVATTTAERRSRSTACCYTIDYPPPPGG